MGQVIDASDKFNNPRFKDFDQAFAENQKEPIQFKIFGAIETMPANLPAAMVLKIMRLQATKGDNLSDADLIDIAVSIFGTDRVDGWCNKGLDIVMLAELTSWALQQYGITPTQKAGGQQGNVKAGQQRKKSTRKR